MNRIKIIFPQKIGKGAKFGFFSPSDPIYPRRVEFIKKAVLILSDWGFKTETISDNMLEEWSVLRSSKDRADEFHKKLKDSSLDCLIATWGGKNSSDLLNLLDYELIKAIRKPIIGSSDIAVLLNAITHKTGLITFYGPNVLGKLNQTKEVGLPLLMSDEGYQSNLLPANLFNEVKIVRRGLCEGRLIGGSLGTFTLGLSGTEFIPQFNKIVFFFETASLDYYRIRQHLQNLKNTNFLKKITGLIVGATNQIKEDSINLFEKMLLDFFPESVPIITTELFGHGFYYNPTFPIGRKIKIDTSKVVFKIEPGI